MKINKVHIQTLSFVLLYMFALYFWSQPLQERKIPYGEYDAMSHFEVADYMAYNDKSFMQLPDYIDIRYGTDNNFKPHTLWYPPTFHASLAVAEAASGERIVPVFFMNTILSTFVIITSYFVINSLFGYLPAILSSMLLIFSPRDFMPYLWGQWPERFSYAFVPLVMYCLYQYYLSFNSNNPKPVYIYLMAALLGAQILVHPLGFFHSAFALIVLYAILWIKHRKFAFSIRHFLVAALIFLMLFMAFPFQTFNIFSVLGLNSGSSANEAAESKAADYSRIFKWSMNPKDYAGSVPDSYFSYKEMHGLWTLPFLLMGIFIIFFRRRNEELFLIAWLVSLYLALHRDFVGIFTFLHRSLSATGHIFSPIIAIGAVYAASLIKIPKNYSLYLKYALCLIFIYFVFSVNMPYASGFINKNTYNPLIQSGFLTTLSPEQFSAADWSLRNIPIKYNITVLGIPHQEGIISTTAKKIRWSVAVSQHVIRYYFLLDDKEEYARKNYVMFDYTMLAPLNMKELYDNMQNIEQNITSTHSMVYNKDNIRIYRPNGA